jgi:serine/threonine protein kinase
MRINEILDQLSSEEKVMMDFLKRCLEIDPKMRITCEEAIRHEWFKQLLISQESQIESRVKAMNSKSNKSPFHQRFQSFDYQDHQNHPSSREDSTGLGRIRTQQTSNFYFHKQGTNDEVMSASKRNP